MWKDIGKAWRTAWCGIKEHWCAMWRAFGGFWGVWDYRYEICNCYFGYYVWR